ncbi:hypothetical protein POTOM_011540 [Populus tomentosa]|uniref:MMS19 nucleotide excision repair protein n=1 Tax=Populus tomentosa TaxID=118781 RepID=A0A8X8D8R8_POPTO|nr:hypothetical protein POTOM_011540 [Populus tomentosa]
MAEPSQLTQHIESFVDSSRSSTQQAASLDAIVSFVKNDVVTISSLVREMEMYLTTTDSIIRARGILLLGEALKCLSSKPLDAATIHSMTSFFKERLKKSNEVFLRFSFLISLGFTLKPFFEFLCGIFVYAGMVIDYNSSENSIIVSLQGFNYGAHMNRKNRSNLVYALGTQAGIVSTTLLQKRGKLEMALARRKAGQSAALSPVNAFFVMASLLFSYIKSRLYFETYLMADWRALRGALVGCLALVKRKSGGMVTSSDAKGVAESFLQNLQVQSLGQHDRKLCFELMECLLEHYPHAVASLWLLLGGMVMFWENVYFRFLSHDLFHERVGRVGLSPISPLMTYFDVVVTGNTFFHDVEQYEKLNKGIGDDLIYGICEAIDGEKDPQCLMLAFHIMEVLVRVFPDPCGPIESFASDLFGILSSYFPIHFTHPKAEEDVEVKRDDLSRALMDKFGAVLDDFQEMFGAVNSAVYKQNIANGGVIDDAYAFGCWTIAERSLSNCEREIKPYPGRELNSFHLEDMFSVNKVREMEMYLTTTDSIIRARAFFEFLCGKDGVISVKDVWQSTNAGLLVQYKIPVIFFFRNICYAGMVIDYNSSENSIIVSLQGFNYGAHMNRKNRSNLVYALGTQAGIVSTTLLQKRGKLEMALARRKAGQSSAALMVVAWWNGDVLGKCLLQVLSHDLFHERVGRGDDLIYGICEAIDGEKDPQCLMLAFHIMEPKAEEDVEVKRDDLSRALMDKFGAVLDDFQEMFGAVTVQLQCFS